MRYWVLVLLMIGGMWEGFAQGEEKLEGMVWIAGGSFEMGCEGEGCGEDEQPLRKVWVDGFYMAEKEVTFANFDQYCQEVGLVEMDDNGWGRGEQPAVALSWYDAVAYCNWLSEKERLEKCYTIDMSVEDVGNTSKSDMFKMVVNWDAKANGYRLPTEAEWEYAASMGGKGGAFGNGKDVAVPNEINFDGVGFRRKMRRFRKRPGPVGSFEPNAWGLYDMSGNVWEWCWDWYWEKGYVKKGKETRNPRGIVSGSYRVIRGGSWHGGVKDLRVKGRGRCTPSYGLYYVGFRVVRGK